MALTAAEWKRFYAEERAALGRVGLEGLVRSAPEVALPTGGALLFPHTRLAASGRLTAAVARAVVRAGHSVVLALGVLHGGRERDRELVRRARSGDERAQATLRRVHGKGAPRDHGHAAEEFSLDGFRSLLEVAANVEGREAPRLVERYPFLTGRDPHTLPGIEELSGLVADGAALVATADVIHHGLGYETPRDLALPVTRETLGVARAWATEQLDALGTGDLKAFEAHVARDRSDFRHSGPVLGLLLGGRARFDVCAFDLVSYADVLGSRAPTWVAALLARAEPVA